MIPKSTYLAYVVLAGLSCVSLFGQEKGDGDQLVTPHRQFSAVSLTQSGRGVHLGGAPNDWKIYGDSYKSMLLTQASVEGTEIRVPAVLSYLNTSNEVVASSFRQPATTTRETYATFHFEYAALNTVPVPPHVVLEIENTGVIEYWLNNCQFSLSKWHKAS